MECLPTLSFSNLLTAGILPLFAERGAQATVATASVAAITTVAIGLRIDNNEPPKGAEGTSSGRYYKAFAAELQLCRSATNG
jgi:hypothetical protein